MKSSSLIDYLSCILFRAAGWVIRLMPVCCSSFLGRRIGDLCYYLDPKHRVRAYANIKVALSDKYSPEELRRILKEFYRSFGQSVIEIFLIPCVDAKYMAKYITVCGQENIRNALKRGKGVILAAIHAGSWELSNIICANLGLPFSLFVREQALPRLNSLLNSYRRQKGCRIITREDGLRDLIAALKANQAIGMTVDQGGKGGMLVDFFGRSASMPTGAVKLAMKYGSSVIPVFFCREKGPYIKAWAGAEIAITRSGRQEEDLRDNLRRIITVFEDFISKHPKEYLWTYKIWKYSDARRVLILSDGKAGHLRQSEAALGITQSVLKEKGINSRVDTVEVKFKNSLSRFIFNICVLFSGKYSCQDCLWCFKHSLSKETLSALIKASPDIIISAGSSLAGINCLLSRLNLSKSIVLMRPGLLGVRRFSLAVIPKHDRPSKRKNTVALSAALNLIDKAYLKEQSDKLCALQGLDNGALYIGILIGGNSRRFILTPESVKGILKEAVLLSKALGAGLLITTSRRTPLQVDRLVKINTKDCPQVKLAVIANENNIPEAVGGILGLSSIVIVTPESISMISEAVNSGKYVFVVEGPGLSRKHRRFIRGLSGAKFIYPVKTEELNSKVLETWNKKPPGPALDDNNLVAQALRRVL